MKQVFLLLLASIMAAMMAFFTVGGALEQGMHGSNAQISPSLVFGGGGQPPALEGVVQEVADSWLMTNLGIGEACYYKQAEIDVPIGFVNDSAVSIHDDPNETAFWMVPKEGTASSIAYCCISGLAQNADITADTVQPIFADFYGTNRVSEVKVAQVGGISGSYFTLYWDAEVELVIEQSMTINCYFPAAHDSCIILTAYVSLEEGEPIPTDDELLALIEPFVRGMRIETFDK